MSKTRFLLVNLCFALFFVFALAACGRETMTKKQLMGEIQKHDPDAVEVLPESMKDGVTCASYIKGCLRGLKANAMELDFLLIEFETPQQAQEQARILGGASVKNWYIDDVANEPRLLKFFQKYLGAVVAPQTAKEIGR